MKYLYKGRLILKVFFLLILLPSVIIAQASYFTPAAPLPGSNLEIVYNPFSEAAQFSINDEVYIIYSEIDQEGERSSGYLKMEKEKSTFVSDIYLSPKSAFLHVYFITLSENSWDTNANLKIGMYNNSGIRVRNGSYNTFEEEIINYPDNFPVYRHKWFLEKLQKPGTYHASVKQDLSRLIQIRDTSAGMLFAQSYAYLLVNEPDESLNIINRMIKHYPDKAYTYDAVNLFINELFSGNMEGTLYEKIKNLGETLVLKKASSPYAWDLISTFSTSVFSDSCLTTVCQEWIKNQPDNPSPYYLLSFILSRQNSTNYSYRKLLTDKFINLSLNGNLRLYGDVGGKTTLNKLSTAYSLLSEIYLAENNLTHALSAIHAAIGLNKGHNEKMFLLNGDIWFGLSNYNLAEESYIKAWSSGSKDAKDRILKCYQVTHNDTTGFESYFIEKIKTDFSESRTGK